MYTCFYQTSPDKQGQESSLIYYVLLKPWNYDQEVLVGTQMSVEHRGNAARGDCKHLIALGIVIQASASTASLLFLIPSLSLQVFLCHSVLH